MTKTTLKLLKNRFVLAFKTNSSDKLIVDCADQKPVEKQSCRVDLAAFHPCTAEKGYGFKEGTPCIFLKLNKIYMWEPDYYKSESELPEKMPKKLQSHIRERFTSQASTEVVWVSCEGENPADIENLGEKIEYKSLNLEQGFHGNYFPYKNTPGYMQPLVAVRFLSVKREFLILQLKFKFSFCDVPAGVLINIECKAWAKNIKHDRQDRRGSVHFELMIDYPPKEL